MPSDSKDNLDAFVANLSRGDLIAASNHFDDALGGPNTRRAGLTMAAALAYAGFKLARWSFRSVRGVYLSARASPSLVLKAAGSANPASFVVATGRLLRSKSARLSEQQFVAVLDALSANPAVQKLDHERYADVMALVWRLSCRVPAKTKLYPVAWAVHDGQATEGFPRAVDLADRRNFLAGGKKRRRSGASSSSARKKRPSARK